MFPGSTILATLTGLDAGSYLIAAKMDAANFEGTTSDFVECLVTTTTDAGNPGVETELDSTSTLVGLFATAPLSLQAFSTLTAAGEVSLKCSSDSGLSRGIIIKLSAIKVDSLVVMP